MSNPQHPSLAIFEQFATVARAVGHPHRLMLLQLLGQGETSVEDLSRRAALTVGNTSQHLQHLRRAGLLVSRKAGQRVFYAIADDAVLAMLSALRSIAERNLAEARQLIQDYFDRTDDLEPLSRKDLMKLIRSRQVTVLDVRSQVEFAASHLPGAINIPIDELTRRLKEIPHSRQVVAYCRGPYCIFSYEAVAELRKRGYDARRLQDGYPEWKASGLPVESTLSDSSGAKGRR